MSIETLARKRLVLGFDAGCGTCRALAERIEKEVGEKLEVRGLGEPRVRQWREQALGEDAPWIPTLIEVSGNRVRAWTGIRMGLRLNRALGVRDTWQVMQAIGDMGSRRAAASRVSAMSRGKFLKGVGGAALAFSVLSTAGNAARPALASSSTEELGGSELFQTAKRMAARTDVKNVAGEEWVSKIQAGGTMTRCVNGDCASVIDQGSCSVQNVNGELQLSGDCVRVAATRHKLENGNTMLAMVYALSERQILAYYEYDAPEDGVKTTAKIWDTVDEEGASYRLNTSSHNDMLDKPAPVQGEGEVAPRQADDPCGGCNSVGPGAPPSERGERSMEQCRATSVLECAAFAAGCTGCAAACPFVSGAGGIAGCALCLFSNCPAAITNCCGTTEPACVTCTTTL